jgi:antitoxin component of MazEF toxin-antitoxin module
MYMTKSISKLWIQGNNSTCLVIPKKVASEYGLTDDNHVTVEGTKEGILIKKLEI